MRSIPCLILRATTCNKFGIKGCNPEQVFTIYKSGFYCERFPRESLFYLYPTKAMAEAVLIGTGDDTAIPESVSCRVRIAPLMM